MCLEQAKLGKWEEPCSAARCMQSRGICRTASQLCTRWPCEMAEALRGSYACPLCSPARARQPSVCRASGCAPPAPAVLPEERRERTNPLLWPQFLKRRSRRPRAQSKTIGVNLQVSIVVWVFFPLFYCVSCLSWFYFPQVWQTFCFYSSSFAQSLSCTQALLNF